MSEDAESPLNDVRAVAEALADVLAERGLVVSAAPAPSARVLDASEVGLLLGRDRQWVYDHAADLGAFRYGDGPKARLGFDIATVERWKRERQIRRTAPRAATRRRRSQQGAGNGGANLIPYEASG